MVLVLKVSGFGPTFFEKKVAKKLLISWLERILHKFSIKCLHFIGFEAPISSLHASVTADIESSKLRKIKSVFDFSKICFVSG